MSIDQLVRFNFLLMQLWLLPYSGFYASIDRVSQAATGHRRYPHLVLVK